MFKQRLVPTVIPLLLTTTAVVAQFPKLPDLNWRPPELPNLPTISPPKLDLPNLNIPGVRLPNSGEVLKEIGNVPKNVERESREALGQPTREIQIAAGNVVRTYQKAGSDTVATIHKAGDDAYATYVKALEDGARETRTAFDESIEAGQAAAKFTERQLKSTAKNLEKGAGRLQEGKFVDAVWHWSTDNLGSSEDNFFKATQDSKLINQAAATAASTYGGPGGAAAYAAWSTYKATGDANLAFRAGFVAAASSQAGTYTAKMPTGTMGELVKKTAMAGAAGGIAVAAAGGDQEAVQKAFLQSGGTVLVQGSMDRVKGYSPKADEAVKLYGCISAKDVKCFSETTYGKKGAQFLKDKYGNPLTQSKVGQVATTAWKNYNEATVAGKRIAEVIKISKLPGKEAIPVLNNKYVMTWVYRDGNNVSMSAPTVVLTQVAQNPPFKYKVTYTRSEELAVVAAAGKTSQLQSQPRSRETLKRPAKIISKANSKAPAKEAPAAKTTAVYVCPIRGFNRTVTVTPYGLGCEAWYKQEDEERTLIWRTDTKRHACLAEAKKFVAEKLRAKGLQCRRVA
ncbi:hypothetical protein [Variovorax guangxiensis]|uniref:Uncharacterized protein n=1 Tax=Variovorax guangxiensis TaxID=1775474 RepID=A0A840FWY9_9BURK|nr:hypothetical protein [Variovorax guangxiensis]MBB4223960.1 hypothetical protein [Variovorax guangxiensis]